MGLVQVDDIPTRWNTENQSIITSESPVNSNSSVMMQNILKGSQLKTQG